MNVIIRFKRLFRWNKGVYQIWSTDAISIWLDEFKKSAENGVNIIVTEGTMQKLRKGIQRYVNCRLAVEYIRKKKIVELETPNNMKTLPVEDEVIAAVKKLYKKGYNVELVTCNKEQANKAKKFLGTNVKLLKGNRVSNQNDNFIRDLQKNNNAEDELVISCLTRGKDKYISIRNRINVYDATGSRRIGKDGFVCVKPSDTCSYLDSKYYVKSMNIDTIILRKITN